MARTPNEIGKEFENKVLLLLEKLSCKYPDNIAYESQPTLVVHSGREYRPDFKVTVSFLPIAELTLFLECQSRKTSKPGIADKIAQMQSGSKYNIFLFVYDASIPEATSRALETNGFQALQYSQIEKLVDLMFAKAITQREHEQEYPDGPMLRASATCDRDSEEESSYEFCRKLATSSALFELNLNPHIFYSIYDDPKILELLKAKQADPKIKALIKKRKINLN